MSSGGNKNIKLLQKELKKAGARPTAVRRWMKCYRKIQKNYPTIKKDYEKEREKLNSLYMILKQMEACFTDGKDVKTDLKKTVKQLRAVKELTGHEFLVDKGNTEVFLTFSRLKTLCASIPKLSDETMLFLHSETENLMDMIKEVLENELPDLHMLTYFTRTRNIQELREVPHEEKLRKIKEAYHEEFRMPMEEIISAAMEHANKKTPLLLTNGDISKEERINYLMEGWIWK